MARKKKGKVVDEVVEEELSDLLGIVEEDDTKELLSETTAPEDNEKRVLPDNSNGVPRRMVGFHPITKEPVYK
jgi:hypothetical protein